MAREPFDMDQHNYELDKNIADVMPKSWDGHQRISNYEMFMT